MGRGQVVLLERVILDVEQKRRGDVAESVVEVRRVLLDLLSSALTMRGASPVTRRVFGSWKLPLNTQPQVNIEFAAPNCARGMPRSF